MRVLAFCFLVMMGSIFCIGMPAWAQAQDAKTQAAPTEQAAAAAPAAPTPAAAPAKLSREMSKKARQVGFHAQVSKGVIMYCKEDAATGSLISSTWCLTQIEFDNYLLQLKYTADNVRTLQKAPCTGTCAPGKP